jgi:hypothetical protein
VGEITIKQAVQYINEGVGEIGTETLYGERGRTSSTFFPSLPILIFEASPWARNVSHVLTSVCYDVTQRPSGMLQRGNART